MLTYIRTFDRVFRMWEIFLIAGGICQHDKASIWLGEVAENMRSVVGGVVASAQE
jgi:hypothetical protein